MKKELKDLNLLDRFLFAEAIEDPDILQPMLEIILEKEIKLEEIQAEKEHRTDYKGKRIILDVSAFDEDGNAYGTEVQKKKNGDLIKRSRYYHSTMDRKLIEEGQDDYNALKDSYLIMIAPFDLFGKGLFRYDFEMICKNDSELSLNDGAHRIFLNTRGINDEGISEELIDLLHYIEHSNESIAVQSSSEKIMQIHKKVNAIKESEEMGIKFMNAYEELMMERKEARAEGEAAGMRAEKIAIARKLKTRGMSIAEIADITGLTVLDIEKL